MTLRYRPEVLEELARHGVIPDSTTPPDSIRSRINDLYLIEIRRLRTRMLEGEIPRAEYASHVEALRASYPILSLPTQFWTEDDGQ
jgi:hypothetical protein